MHYRKPLWVAVTAIVLMLAAAAGWHYNRTPDFCRQHGRCPNIVFVILDDMSWDHFGFLSQQIKVTPHIDQLAASGYVFTDAYNSNSRCRPSLATLLTGQLPQRNGIYANHGVLEMRDDKALPLLLEQAGYKTFAGGKFWEGEPGLMHFTASDLDTFHFVRQSQEKLEQFFDHYAGQAPLFVWWAPMMPHLPHNAPAAYVNQVSLASIELPFAMTEAQANDYRINEQAYRATQLWVDDEVGKLMQSLERHHLRDNTWIVLLADNGWDVARTDKGSPYDIGVRTPLVIIGPGVAPAKNSTLVNTRDIYGSVLDLVGLPVEKNRDDEVSLLQVARGDASPLPASAGQTVFWASYPGYTAKSEPMPRAERDVYALSLRQGHLQYNFYVKSYAQSDADDEKAPVVIHSGMQAPPTFNAGDEELFDLATDAYSSNNLAHEPVNQQQLLEFRRAILQWWEEKGGKPLDAFRDCNIENKSVLCEKYTQSMQGLKKSETH